MNDPLRFDLEIQLTGAPDQVSGYLNELADRLCAEIEARTDRARWDDPIGSVASTPLNFTSALTASSKRMARIFADVDRQFAKAAAKPGQTEAVRAPYARLADGILDGMDDFWEMQPPVRFAAAYYEYRAMLRSMYEQLALWPSQIRHAAAAVATGGCDVHLSIRYDSSKVERALAV